MFLSRNFTQLRPGRYEDASQRIVVVTGPPELVKVPIAGSLEQREVEKWTGTRMKADGRTPASTMHYTSEGSLWGSRATSTNEDLAKAISYDEVAA